MKKFSTAFWFFMTAICCNAQFIDVTADQGIVNINEGTFDGNGVSFYDFNYDGWDDLTIANGADEPLFFENVNGNFQPVPWSVNIDPAAHIVAIIWSDYDNDGDADLLTTQLGGSLELWNNAGDFSFTEVSDLAGLDNGSWEYWGAAWCDYDHDGCLDLYVSKYYDDNLNDNDPNHESRLYNSNCDGTFTDVTVSSGVWLNPRATFQPVFMDYNHDGWEDLFLVIDRNVWTNKMFLNNHDGTFTDVTLATNLNQAFDAMTGTVDDYDNDGDLDIYVTNGWPGNKLYEHNANHTFTNIAAAAGVTVNLICWAALWLDYDNNTWQDLFVGTTANFFGPAQNNFYINNQNDTFTLANSAVGLNGDLSPTFCAAMGDMDNDGYYDFVTNNNDPSPSKLWQNDGGENNYLSVTLSGVNANRDGFGSWLHCYAGGNHYVRYTHGGENLAGQNSRKEIFGLGDFDIVDSLVVQWNMGNTDRYYNLVVNQHIYLTENEGYAEAPSIAMNGVLCGNNPVILDAGNFIHYEWSSGDTTSTLSINEPGNYSAIVTDEFGTQIQLLPVAVSLSDAVQMEITTMGPSCFGGSDGYTSVALIDTDIESITWSNDEQTPAIENLEAGTYSFYGLASNGCAISGLVELTQPDEIVVTPVIQNASCNGGNDGNAQLIIVGGIQNYTVNWFGENPLQLAAGNYMLMVTDAAQCTVQAEVAIGEPEPLEAIIVVDSVTCHGSNDGHAEIQLTGGTPGYTIDWFGYDSTQLAAGEYGVQVTDVAQCSSIFSFIISEPPPIGVYTNITHVTCSGAADGAVEVLPYGGSPDYTIDWFGVNPELLGAGIHSFEVTDNLDCVMNFEVEVTEPDALAVETTLTNVTCNGDNTGSVEVSATGGTPEYEIDWMGNDPQALAAGNFEAQVFDAQGCSLNFAFNISQPDPITISFELTPQYENGELGTVAANVQGGIPPYQYNFGLGWTDDSLLANLDSGIYTLLIADANDCLAESLFTIDYVTGQIENGFTSHFHIYPNPADQWLEIENSGMAGTSLVLCDMHGRQSLCCELESGKQRIEVQQLASGLYNAILIAGSELLQTSRLHILHAAANQ